MTLLLGMEDSRSVETEVELEYYEEIVGDLDYTTPVTDRPPSPISYSEYRLTAATFKGSIVHSSESTVTSSVSAAIVDSVTWPDLRSPCSIAGNYQVPRPLAQRSDGRSFATFTGTDCFKQRYSKLDSEKSNKCATSEFFL